jgi:hypothetical protein
MGVRLILFNASVCPLQVACILQGRALRVSSGGILLSIRILRSVSGRPRGHTIGLKVTQAPIGHLTVLGYKLVFFHLTCYFTWNTSIILKLLKAIFV